jgi:DNA helicase-2/ATP-dependent DNA helicase PcrA
MTDGAQTHPDAVDDGADEAIRECLQLDSPTSFFLLAGAGSGKTRSLVKALSQLCQQHRRALQLRGQRVGVITYTKAACEEIKQRLDFDPLVEVSTIHSFVWSLICDFPRDIKRWLQQRLTDDIAELEAKQAKSRTEKTRLDSAKNIQAKQTRLTHLDHVGQFTYSPNGDNRGKDALNHAEVIAMGTDFMAHKPLMQQLLVTRFPVLLIDESQDTNKLLLDALLGVQQVHSDRFCLGLFGDPMQRIYADGKVDLEGALPHGWATPAKQLNHRCPQRIVKLINDLRAKVDGKSQRPRSDSKAGSVRLFLLPNTTEDKAAAEQRVAEQMGVLTGDAGWNNPREAVKTLLLEHHMAARRMGFLEMFEPLYRTGKLATGLLEGSLPGLRLFADLVLPIVKAHQAGDDFAVASLVRKHSPLLQKELLATAPNQPELIRRAREAVNRLLALWAGTEGPLFIDVLRCVQATELFEIPESLQPIALRTAEEQHMAAQAAERPAALDTGGEVLDAWDAFLQVPFQQIEGYVNYVNGTAAFATHQGIKGLEFPRVMVIIDDSDAKGFMFSYDKLFGTKQLSPADQKNQQEGKETHLDRTIRLLYVTCSRAEQSLALVAYSEQPEAVLAHVLGEGWFEAHEVEVVST